jgi:hypothetical protein
VSERAHGISPKIERPLYLALGFNNVIIWKTFYCMYLYFVAMSCHVHSSNILFYGLFGRAPPWLWLL